jgi:hypothetical protein
MELCGDLLVKSVGQSGTAVVHDTYMSVKAEQFLKILSPRLVTLPGIVMFVNAEQP